MIGWCVWTTTVRGKFEIDPWWRWGERGAEAMVAWDRDVAPLLTNMPAGVLMYLHSYTYSLQVVFQGWTVKNERWGSLRSVVYNGTRGPWQKFGAIPATLAEYLA